MKSDETELPIVIQPHNYIKLSSVIISFILIVFGTVILFNSNIFAIFVGIIFILIALLISLYVLFARFGYDGNKIKKKTILGKLIIKLDEIDKIGKTKIFGTVGKVPFSISSVEIYLIDGSKKILKLRLFPYDQTLMIFHKIQRKLENKV